VISALGANREAFWTSLTEGASGIRPMELVPPGTVRFPNAAEVKDYRLTDHFEEKDSLFLDRFAQFAAIAAREAVRDSGIAWTNDLRERAAVVTGSSIGGQTSEDESFRELYERKQTRFSPFTIPKSMTNAGASRISFEQGVTGPVYTVSSACSSANHAIGQAFWMVRGGAVEVAIAGGSEAPFSPGILKAWEGMRVVSPDTCRPFSRDRKGLILGEGAAMLVLEAFERAQARGARIYGEIAGFGMSSDAHHLTQPLVEGAARAMRAAQLDASMSPESIGYINAHGTGTLTNDATETEAIHAVFGTHASKLMVSSTKSMHGHALGAAGAIEASVTVLALSRGVIPPTANFLAADPACDLDVVPNIARKARYRTRSRLAD
jgi:nodulation protein E